MPRRLTFSLACLFFFITVVCVLVSLAVHLPIAFLFGPAILLMIALASFSQQPHLLMFNAVIGGILGFAAYPITEEAMACCDISMLGYLTLTASPTIGVLLTAGATLLAEISDRRAQHK